MKAKLHVHRAIRNRKGDLPKSIFLLKDLIDIETISQPGAPSYADSYYLDDALMEERGIIAACDLDFTSKTIEGTKQDCYYPNATYVVSDFRNKGYGTELYKLCLQAIALDIIQGLVWKPMLAWHSVCDNEGCTSVGAKRLYNSLIKDKYLKETSQEGVYHIRKFPSSKYFNL